MVDSDAFGDPRLPERFWSKVQVRESGCWEWTASVSNQTGYGWFRVEGKSLNSHRVCCQAFHGVPLDAGLVAMHSCDNRICVNPSHLSWGTRGDNQQDMASKGRGRKEMGKTHCPQGHPFSEDNTYITKAGTRTCRECYRKHWREWNQRKKEGATSG